MGLYASFNLGEAGLPKVLRASVGGIPIEVEVDYTSAYEAFVDTFKEVSQQLVPVDTGFLRGSLDAGVNGTNCWASAGAHYAQYVEYGTWKMGAQPYFEPALQEACGAFSAEAQLCLMDAQMELEMEIEMLQAELADETEEEGGDFGGGGIGGNLAMAGMMLLLFPVILVAYGIYRTLTDPLTGRDEKRTTDNIDFGGFMPNIIIS